MYYGNDETKSFVITLATYVGVGRGEGVVLLVYFGVVIFKWKLDRCKQILDLKLLLYPEVFLFLLMIIIML